MLLKGVFMQVKRDNSKKWIVFAIFAVLSLLWTAFIFSNSLKDATSSLNDSNRVTRLVERTIESVFGIEIEETGTKITTENISYFVRKFAHAFEFAVLGVLSYLALISLLRSKLALLSLLFPIAIAICDELLQGSSAGRSPQFTDVIIDTAGATVAIVISFLAIKLHKNKGKKH